MNLNGDLKYCKPVFKKGVPDDSFKFRHVPEPSGDYPYHLYLSKINPEISNDQMVFHMVGDTGGRRNPSFQKLVASEMANQHSENIPKENNPLFLYHLGDVVYHHGEAEQYKEQFFEPYSLYPGPIFAIAGNHDSDVNPDNITPYKSLDAFRKVFCDTTARPIPFSGGADRMSMTQPHVFWTLKTPLANIIGLYSNIPKYGVITEEQRKWFIEELKNSHDEKPGKALIICLHHAPYTADINHGSSRPMIDFLDGAFKETGITPHIVFSGHVHNYQRFEKRYKNNITVPFIVSGAGGFDELHPVASITDERFTSESSLFKGVDLVSYCDSKHGFLKISITRNATGLSLTGEYYSIPHDAQTDGKPNSALTDQFTIPIQ